MFKFSGFTLPEIIITIAISAILVSLAHPYFIEILISNEVEQIKKTLTIYIQKAKSDAQTHQKNVTLCATQDFSSCSSDWNHGFIGFLDANRNKRRDNTETILYSNPVQPKYGSLAWRGTLNINSLTFQGDTGLPRGSNGSFYYCSSRSNHHLQIILSNMGHVRTQEISCC